MIKRLRFLTHTTPRAHNPALIALCLSLWLASVGNWPLWRAMAGLPELGTPRGVLFMFGLGLTIAAGTMALLSLAAWRHSIKPIGALCLLVTASSAHFMGSYGVVIDPTMMRNVLQTDMHEAGELLSGRLLASLLLLAGAPLWLLWRTPVQRLSWAAQSWRNALGLIAGLWLAGSLLVVGYADMSSTMRNHKSLRYMVTPLNAFYALGKLGFDAGHRPRGPPEPIGSDAKLLPRRADAKPSLLMLVVGETARADHFSLNGYLRRTNAFTAAFDPISFSQVSSCGTSTAASLPCMFSPLGRDGFAKRVNDQENLLDLLHRAGLAVLWLDNQAGCKGVCARVPQALAADAPSGAAHPPGTCADGECFDQALLTGLDQRLAALPQAQRDRGVVLVLHQMGSHGPAYSRRSPADAKPFMPECANAALQDCEHQALVNAYDNSIAYTDRVLAGAIGWLSRQHQAFDPMLLYVSDHGESLGESNLYLHGMPYAVAPREQTHVPMLLWLPGQTEQHIGATRQCLRERRHIALSHDNLFHSVLGLLRVTSQVYRPALDFSEACRTL